MKETLQKSRYPCWLSPAQLHEAQALRDMGFRYCGNADEYCIGYLVGSCGCWKFYTCDGEIALDAICNGALYSLCLEDNPAATEEDDFLEKQLALMKKTLRAAQREYSRPQGIQLTLF